MRWGGAVYGMVFQFSFRGSAGEVYLMLCVGIAVCKGVLR